MRSLLTQKNSYYLGWKNVRSPPPRPPSIPDCFATALHGAKPRHKQNPGYATIAGLVVQ
jgi:hypothetical protein